MSYLEAVSAADLGVDLVAADMQEDFRVRYEIGVPVSSATRKEGNGVDNV